ncbi:MAG: transposase family protein [Clostridia bacterium]|nr:transposase family protein [Clostridia bacterium]
MTSAEFNEKDKSVHVYIEAKKTSKYPYPECHKLCRRYDNEDEERIWRHADVVLYPCYIHCRRPRVECEEHGIKVTDALWSRKGSRNTLLFEGHAMMLAKIKLSERQIYLKSKD